ncbi:MAG TPA: BTAD domain-containing putative transcriptional regulator, partial [Solirubrobacteraceae bacterium]|nr:BTAD domain-containing putative transcriptional regulator [Solirubrobacteraceae bacterium]
MGVVEFRILGPLEAAVDGRFPRLGAPKQRALLAILVLHQGETVSVDRLIDQLWGERAPSTATKAVQGYVSNLRKVLGEGVILTRGRGYVLELERGRVDVDRFEAMSAEGRRALAAGDAERARDRLGEALKLWRGEPLAEFSYEQFAHDQIARLEEARLTAIEDRIDAELALGDHAAVVGELETLVRNHPLEERLQAQRMLALYRSGRQADALESYRDARRKLIDDLGIEPTPALRELERAILEQDPQLDPPPAATRRLSGSASAPAPRVTAAPPDGAETVAIVITDLVGSTSLESRAGTEVAEQVRREHFGLLREVVAESGGREVKTTGDGLMVSFGTATAAVECAVAMQQMFERRNRFAEYPLHLRIGIGAGEARVEGGDYFGMPAIEAARLCERAPGGGILVSPLTAMMSARGEGLTVEPAGKMELKGIPRPVEPFHVRWNPAPA